MTMPRSRWVRVVLVLAITAGVVYLLLTYTQRGRLVSMYMIGGWPAPVAVRTACIDETSTRVAEKFTLPLAMTPDATEALREYWYYSYYKQCLHDAGYAFVGGALPASKIVPEGDGLRYTNYRAGVTTLVPVGAELVRDNELNVDFDYRLLRSALVLASSTLHVDVYTTHDDIDSFDTLKENLAPFPGTEATILSVVEAQQEHSIRYLEVTQDDGLCGAVFVSLRQTVVYVYSACSDRASIDGVLENAGLLAEG